MAFLSYSSVPGMSVPGAAVPGKDGTGTPGTRYVFIGPYQLYYLDYLDVLTQKTLSAVPGGSYSMMPVNSRAGLTVPPPDGRWAGGGFMLRRPRAVRRLSAAQVAAARERALAAHGHYVSSTCPHCAPASRESVPTATRVPGPDTAPVPSLAEVRAQVEQARVASGWYEQRLKPAAQPQPQHAGPTAPLPVPQPSQMQVTRAQLEEARVAHGHYAPGGCKLCMSGGQA